MRTHFYVLLCTSSWPFGYALLFHPRQQGPQSPWRPPCWTPVTTSLWSITTNPTVLALKCLLTSPPTNRPTRVSLWACIFCSTFCTHIQCGTDVMSIFSKLLTKTPHSSPVRARYGVSFVGSNSDLFSVLINAMMSKMLSCIGLH